MRLLAVLLVIAGGAAHRLFRCDPVVACHRQAGAALVGVRLNRNAYNEGCRKLGMHTTGSGNAMRAS